MKILKFRTKIEAIAAVSMLILIAIGSAFAITVTITNNKTTVTSGTHFYEGNYDFISGSHFNLTSKIYNTNGHIWNATGANLQLAINDLGTTGGTVWCGSDITLSSAITLKNYTTIDFCGNDVTLSANVTFINMTGGNFGDYIQNVNIRIPNYHCQDIIRLYIGPTGVWENRIWGNTFQNIKMINLGSRTNYTGIHLYLHVETDPASIASLCMNRFSNIEMSRTKKGILIESGDTWDYMNDNNFDNIMVYGCSYGVEFKIHALATGLGLSDSTFNNVRIQINSWGKYGFANITGNYNHFTNCLVWDWSAVTAGVYEWCISSRGYGTYINAEYVTTTAYSDAGTDSWIYCANEGLLKGKETLNLGSLFNLPYDYIIFNTGTGGAYCVAQRSSDGVIVKNSTYANSTVNYLLGLSSCRSIFFKRGTYNFSGYVGASGSRPISWIGEEKNSTVIRVADTKSFAGGMIALDPEYNWTFRNLKFDGNRALASGNCICFYILDKGGYFTFDNCIFKDWNYRTILCGSLTSYTVCDIRVTNCNFFQCEYGIRLLGDADPSRVAYSTISDNYFRDCNYSIYLDYAHNCSIVNNKIVKVVYSVTGITLSNSVNCSIIGNNIRATTGISETGSSNFNMIVLNDCLGCTTPIDVSGTNTTWFCGGAWRYGFNWGAIS